MTAHEHYDATSPALAALPEWQYDGERRALYRRIVLRDFSQSIALVMRIALEAEKANHHPEWSNVYNQLDVWLTTHDAGGVTERDLHLAAAIDRLLR